MFKYAVEIQKANLINCPVGCSPCEMRAYRFVHSNIDHENNYSPPIVIKPNRNFRTEHEKCNAFSLSFFNSEENARVKYSKLLNSHPALPNLVGDCIAEIQITLLDGACSTIGKTGHFDLHEYSGCSLVGRFTIKGRI